MQPKIRTNFMLDPETKDKIDKLSEAKGCHKSFVVRAAIAHIFEHWEKDDNFHLKV